MEMAVPEAGHHDRVGAAQFLVERPSVLERSRGSDSLDPVVADDEAPVFDPGLLLVQRDQRCIKGV